MDISAQTDGSQNLPNAERVGSSQHRAPSVRFGLSCIPRELHLDGLDGLSTTSSDLVNPSIAAKWQRVAEKVSSDGAQIAGGLRTLIAQTPTDPIVPLRGEAAIRAAIAFLEHIEGSELLVCYVNPEDVIALSFLTDIDIDLALENWVKLVGRVLAVRARFDSRVQFIALDLSAFYEERLTSREREVTSPSDATNLRPSLIGSLMVDLVRPLASCLINAASDIKRLKSHLAVGSTEDVISEQIDADRVMAMTNAVKRLIVNLEAARLDLLVYERERDFLLANLQEQQLSTIKLTEECTRMKKRLETAQRERAEYRKQRDEHKTQREEHKAKTIVLSKRIAEQKRKAKVRESQLKERCKLLEDEIAALRRSKSWRVTKPLRALSSMITSRSRR